MRLLMLTFFIYLNITANAQFLVIDNAFNQIEFNENEEPIETAFKWVSNNITYDIEQLNKIKAQSSRPFKSKESIIKNTLHKRKGVCENYANLFSGFLDKLNIENQLVKGYIKNTEGVVEQDIGHLWVAAKINEKWELFDPTWASGYIDLRTNQFVKKYDNKWFKISPYLLVQTHYPYDPIFQLLNQPKTPEEFYYGTINNFEKPYFDYFENLNNYVKMDQLNQMIATKKRMQKVGLATNLEAEYLDYLSRSISVYKYNDKVKIKNNQIEKTNVQIDKMNQIVENLNEVKENFVNEINSYKGKTISRNLKTKLRLICNNATQNVRNLNAQLKAIKTNDQRFLNTLNENLKSNQEFLGTIAKYKNSL